MGCICPYASYFSKQTNLTSAAVNISVIDFMVALLAGLIIFPAAFSVGVNPDSGPSLIFITLPNVFQQAFDSIAGLGYIISVLFYALLSMAALTSLMSLHEVSTAFLEEELGTCCNICNNRMYNCGHHMFAVIRTLGGIPPVWHEHLRPLRLCHRSVVPSYRRIPYMHLYRMVCTT